MRGASIVYRCSSLVVVVLKHYSQIILRKEKTFIVDFHLLKIIGRHSPRQPCFRRGYDEQLRVKVQQPQLHNAALYLIYYTLVFLFMVDRTFVLFHEEFSVKNK